MEVRFSAEAIEAFLTGNGIAFAPPADRPTVVLPLWGSETTAVLWDGINPWRDAWGNHGGQGGLVSLVGPRGDLGDVVAVDSSRALAADLSACVAIAERYGGGEILVSRAARSDDGGQLLVVNERFGPEGGRGRWEQRIGKASGEDDAAFLIAATNSVDQRLQELWRDERTIDRNRSNRLSVLVSLSGIDDWVNIKRRLDAAPSIERSLLAKLSRSEAIVDIDFFGEEEQLARSLAQRSLLLTRLELPVPGDPSWQLSLQRREPTLMAPDQGPSGRVPRELVPLDAVPTGPSSVREESDSVPAETTE